MKMSNMRYYIYENIKTKKIHICKNKDILRYELRTVHKTNISDSRLVGLYSIIGEVDPKTLMISVYDISNVSAILKATANNAVIRILGG